jgi:hypothetical protein
VTEKSQHGHRSSAGIIKRAMVNEKRFNDWYKHSSDKEIKDKLKRMNTQWGWACGIALVLFIFLFASIGYYETELYIQKGALTESFKIIGFMAGAMQLCEDRLNITNEQLMLDYSNVYLKKEMNITNGLA